MADDNLFRVVDLNPKHNSCHDDDEIRLSIQKMIERKDSG